MHKGRTAAEIAADRRRYEEHQKTGLEQSPRALPGPSARPAPAPDPADARWTEAVPGGCYTTLRLAPGEVLRLAPGGGGSAVSLAAWSARDPSERINLPDTIKVQWTTDLSRGRVVFSDMGRVMLSIVEDSCGAHDALTGGSTAGTAAGTTAGTAAGMAGGADGPRPRNTRDNMLLASAKLGLDRRDMPALLTLFAPVRVDAAGRFEWRPAMLSPGDWVGLRAEMDLLVALSNCPHPLDPDAGVPAPDLQVTVLHARPVPADDPCRIATAEARRGFENNARAQGAL